MTRARKPDALELAQQLLRALGQSAPAANDASPQELDEETKAAIRERARASAERMRRARGR